MTVYLVGAGPGDPKLLTLRACEVLSRADVVVHDRLVDHRVLALAPAQAPRHDVGKRPGEPVRQREINDLLVSLARAHERVVRLKGGDPYVFGRGGEEALVLKEAGISFEVVPGVSSVNGALAYAGIPPTHRGIAASVTVVTGHAVGEGDVAGDSDAAVDAKSGTAVDWQALAKLGGTIVVLMGVAQRGAIARRLISGGLPPATPVAVVENGTLPGQRSVRTRLDRLGDVPLSTPAIIVIGRVAELDLDWFESRPLFGWRVVVTRAADQASALSARLSEEGAIPIEVPTIEIVPPSDGGAALRAAAGRLAEFDWIAFASANAVVRLFEEVKDARALGANKVAAIGRATAARLAERGVVADLVPDVAVAEDLAASFGPAPAGGASVLVPQAASAREALSSSLRELGYSVECVEAYRTVHPARQEAAAARVRGADAVTFASSSTVEGYLATLGRELVPPVVVSIGPVTSRTAVEHGVSVSVEAATASVDALVEALSAYAAAHPKPAAP